MAGTTATEDLGVVDCDRRIPDSTVVAVLTNVGGEHVRRALAGRRCAIVAIAAIVDDAVVIEFRRQPRNGRMTIFTDIVCADMRWVLAGGVGAIVAADAVANYADVIKGSR